MRLEEASAPSCVTACAKGSRVDDQKDGVAGIPLALFVLSDAVEPWVRFVISENAEGESGSIWDESWLSGATTAAPPNGDSTFAEEVTPSRVGSVGT